MKIGEVRVLAIGGGKGAPGPPFGSVVRGFGPWSRGNPKAAEIASDLGWAGCQEPSCGGRGNRNENRVRKSHCLRPSTPWRKNAKESRSWCCARRPSAAQSEGQSYKIVVGEIATGRWEPVSET